ncbi:MAG TPA: DUF2911 domain-containing protein [Gemmatimonadaceae bacterium]|nr:DUF2911 domain-containing protein [Gemmatimonadaceae bacterium]
MFDLSMNLDTRFSMLARTVFLAASVFAFAHAGAQAPATTGIFVSTLGSDTIQVERYTRTGDKLEGDIVRRAPRVQVVHYVADLATGRVKGMSVSTRRYGADAATAPVFSMVTLLADSSASVEVQRAGRADTANSGTRAFKGRAIPAVPGIPPSIGMYEQALMINPPARDTVVVNLVGAGLGPNPTLKLFRRSRDTLVFTSSFSPGWNEIATVDAFGRIQSLDGSATTIKAITRRVPSLDFDALVKAWGTYEAAHGPAGAMSPPDTVRATVGTANIEIAYSRPSRRGRTIFGNVVPLDSVWRTGANAATMFTTSADLIIGNTPVPAGKYTLWTIPSKTGAKLVINSQTGQWGTEYDMSKDFARIAIAQSTLPKPVEEFTFVIVPQGTGGVIKYSWDDREFSVPFRVK